MSADPIVRLMVIGGDAALLEVLVAQCAPGEIAFFDGAAAALEYLRGHAAAPPQMVVIDAVAGEQSGSE